MQRTQRYIVQYSLILLSLFLPLSTGMAQVGSVEPGPSPGRPGRFSEKLEIQPRPPGFRHAQDEEAGAIRINWRAFNLTPEQRDRIKGFRRDFQIKTAGIRKELKYVLQDLRDEMQQSTVERTKLDELLKQLSEIKRKLNDAAIKNILAMKSVLTPKQLQILDEQQVHLPLELKQLRLTNEQQAEIQQIMQESQKQTRILNTALQDLKIELRNMLLSSEDVDSGQLEHLQTAIVEKEVALETGRVNQLLKIRNALTPEQIEQYKRLKATGQ